MTNTANKSDILVSLRGIRVTCEGADREKVTIEIDELTAGVTEIAKGIHGLIENFESTAPAKKEPIHPDRTDVIGLVEYCLESECDGVAFGVACAEVVGNNIVPERFADLPIVLLKAKCNGKSLESMTRKLGIISRRIVAGPTKSIADSREFNLATIMDRDTMFAIYAVDESSRKKSYPSTAASKKNNKGIDLTPIKPKDVYDIKDNNLVSLIEHAHKPTKIGNIKGCLTSAGRIGGVAGSDIINYFGYPIALMEMHNDNNISAKKVSEKFEVFAQKMAEAKSEEGPFKVFKIRHTKRNNTEYGAFCVVPEKDTILFKDMVNRNDLDPDLFIPTFR